jgi:hypothetical protein
LTDDKQQIQKQIERIEEQIEKIDKFLAPYRVGDVVGNNINRWYLDKGKIGQALRLKDRLHLKINNLRVDLGEYPEEWRVKIRKIKIPES